jgi:hypothetical protein
MPLLELNVAPSQKEIRWFSGLWWPCLWAIIGGVMFRKLDMADTAIWLWVFAGVLSIAGLIVPAVMLPFYRLLLYITYPIGFVLSYVILFVMYFAIFTPIGLLVRLFHDSMGRQFDRLTSTYWSPHESVQPQRYFRQF